MIDSILGLLFGIFLGLNLHTLIEKYQEVRKIYNVLRQCGFTVTMSIISTVTTVLSMFIPRKGPLSVNRAKHVRDTIHEVSYEFSGNVYKIRFDSSLHQQNPFLSIISKSGEDITYFFTPFIGPHGPSKVSPRFFGFDSLTIVDEDMSPKVINSHEFFEI